MNAPDMRGEPQVAVAAYRRWFTTREAVLVALVSALVIMSKVVFKMPIHVPGHSGVIWMALYVVGRGLIRKPGAGLMIGIVSGILATAFNPGSMGLLVGVKYLAPGIVLDAVAIASRERLDDPVVGVIAGVLGNLAKLSAGVIVAVLLGLPAGFIVVGLAYSAVTHVVFGAIGGWLGSVVLSRLDRHGIGRDWVKGPVGKNRSPE